MAAQIAERISETFSFAKKMPMLSRATFDDDNPTPGYIYQEINSITYESISSCNSLLDYLVVRLKNKSPYVKYKVLKILCYLSANGHSEFRSGLRHKADVLREAQNFTGPIDYLKGDGPNQQVRAAASELIELLFNVESSALSNIHAMTGPTGKRMEGFGNSPLQPAKSKTWLDSVKNLAEHLPDAANRLKPKNKKENTPPAETSGTAFINYVDFASADSGFKTFLDGQVSLEPSDDEDSTDSENGLSVEAHLVNKITSEGGIRAVPSKEDLIQFTRRCSSLNVEKVFSALNDRLLEPITEVQLKSLHVLDHLLKSDIPEVGIRMSYICTNLHEITKTDNGHVLSKAQKILSIIKAKAYNGKVKKNSHTAVNDSEVSRVVQSHDLLNLDNDEQKDYLAWNKKLKVTDPALQQSVPDDTPTLFSGMSVHAKENTSSTKHPESPAAVTKNSQRLLKDDLFQILDISDGNDDSSLVRSPKTDLDDLFSVTKGDKVPGPVTLNQEHVKGSVTDIFDPLCSTPKTTKTAAKGVGEQRYNTKSKSDSQSPQGTSYESSLISSNGSIVNPGLSGFTGTFYGPVTSGSGTFEDLSTLSRNNTMQPSVTPNITLVGNALPPANRYVSNFPNTSHPIIHPSVLSGGSAIPLRLPPPSQKADFSFVGKSGKADAFSFVQDEMKARK